MEIPSEVSLTSNKKIFVIDTNILMHDPTSIFRFKEHYVVIPILTIEELDNNKKGVLEKQRNARQASRFIDELVLKHEGSIKKGMSLAVNEIDPTATGKLFIYTDSEDPVLDKKNVDNGIIAVTMALKKNFSDRRVILVSNDLNVRIKARALDLNAEGFSTDQVVDDTSLLHTGWRSFDQEFWLKLGPDVSSWKADHNNFYHAPPEFADEFYVNEFLAVDGKGYGESFVGRVIEKDRSGVTIRSITDYCSQKNSVFGIVARNDQQSYALNLLMDPEVDFVTLLGQAGTGKTLLTLASALEQVLERKLYAEIIMTRATVSIGDDIGFLPGTEEEKMSPWMGALSDNLDVLCTPSDDEQKGSSDWGRKATNDLIRSRIKVKSLNFMRGRTFLSKFLIIDEAQNLTPKQMKTLITRAGPGTKVVCLGNLKQIDTPYLSDSGSGLTYVVDRFKGWSHGGNVTLLRGERSRLADHAAEVL